MPAGSVFHWLASASEKLPLPRLGLGLTVSVLTWCVSALARSDSGSPSSDSDTNSILLTYFHVHSFRSIIAFYQQSTFYFWWFLYAILSERELTFTFVSSRSLFAVTHPSVYLSSVTFLRPTQAVQIFGNISMALGTLAIR